MKMNMSNQVESQRRSLLFLVYSFKKYLKSKKKYLCIGTAGVGAEAIPFVVLYTYKGIQDL